MTKKVLILQTHFSTETENATDNNHSGLRLPTWLLKLLIRRTEDQSKERNKYGLSPVNTNEGLEGRWYLEFADDESFNNRENSKWSSWDNRRSFWIQREYLLQTIQDVGFDLVLEQFDSLGPNIAEQMLRGFYQTDHRGTFVGIKTQAKPEDSMAG